MHPPGPGSSAATAYGAQDDRDEFQSHPIALCDVPELLTG